MGEEEKSDASDEYSEPAMSVSIVDEYWEYADPTPDIHAMFLEFDRRCAGLCVPLEGQGGSCSLRLSEPLLKLRPRKDLVETLLHEMIHAYLHVTNMKEKEPHGAKFKEHMQRINKATGTNITVYHNFYDEVELHKRHWWQCNGACQKWPPYFGFVKRANNRAPSSNDFWWGQHQSTCGGQFIKVKEPEGFGQKKTGSKVKDQENKSQPSTTLKQSSIKTLFNKVVSGNTKQNWCVSDDNSSLPVLSKRTPNSDFGLQSFLGKGYILGGSSVPSINNFLAKVHKENLERKQHVLASASRGQSLSEDISVIESCSTLVAERKRILNGGHSSEALPKRLKICQSNTDLPLKKTGDLRHALNSKTLGMKDNPVVIDDLPDSDNSCSNKLHHPKSESSEDERDSSSVIIINKTVDNLKDLISTSTPKKTMHHAFLRVDSGLQDSPFTLEETAPNFSAVGRVNEADKNILLTVVCPVCQKSVVESLINNHLDQCLSS